MRRIHYALIALAVAAADLGTKALVLSRVALHEEHAVIPGFLQIVHVQNSGAAFGLGSTSPLVSGILTAGAVGVFIAVLAYSFRTPLSDRILQTALHLVTGGAIGNLADRFRYGHVTDFIDVFVTVNGRAWHWPAFNIADAAICCGIALLLIAGEAAGDAVEA